MLTLTVAWLAIPPGAEFGTALSTVLGGLVGVLASHRRGRR